MEREQKAWAAGREPKCANEELREDVLMCLVHQNKRRTEQLKRRLDHPGKHDARITLLVEPSLVAPEKTNI